jgi:hypothetical protein
MIRELARCALQGVIGYCATRFFEKKADAIKTAFLCTLPLITCQAAQKLDYFQYKHEPNWTLRFTYQVPLLLAQQAGEHLKLGTPHLLPALGLAYLSNAGASFIMDTVSAMVKSATK